MFGDGWFTTEEEYVANMERIADILLPRYDKVIFTTTTPITPENQCNTNDETARGNELTVPVLRKKGVIINDLYGTVIKDVDRYIRKDDAVHLTDEGIEVCSKQIADLIREVSKNLDDTTAKTSNTVSGGALKGLPVISRDNL